MTSDLLSHWDLMNSFTHWIVCYWWNVSLCSPSVCSCRPPIKKLQVWSVCRRWLISAASQRPTKKRSSWESNCRQSSPTRLNRWNVGGGGGKGAAEGKNEMKIEKSRRSEWTRGKERMKGEMLRGRNMGREWEWRRSEEDKCENEKKTDTGKEDQEGRDGRWMEVGLKTWIQNVLKQKNTFKVWHLQSKKYNGRGQRWIDLLKLSQFWETCVVLHWLCHQGSLSHCSICEFILINTDLFLLWDYFFNFCNSLPTKY